MKYSIILFLLSSQIVFGYYFPITHNSFVIRVTEQDKILINQKQSTLKNLGNQLYDYYSVNSVAQESDAFATYETFTLQDCQSQINSINQSNYHRSWIEKEKRHWEVKLYVLKKLNLTKYRFPSRETYIQIGVKRKTSYNMYIQVLSKIKETIGKLRHEKNSSIV